MGAGSGGELLDQCTDNGDCDDGLRCNGVETCAAGQCQPGAPIVCENAATCAEEPSANACVYGDTSAWLVYQADEETPGINELYAVKESLIGVQRPIKISGSLSSAAEHSTWRNFSWSADGRWLTFGSTVKNDAVSTRYYAIRFDRGFPEPPVPLTLGALSAGALRWSPTGHELSFVGSAGELFWIHLTEEGTAELLRLNDFGQIATWATWASNSALIYTVNNDRPLRVLLNGNSASRPEWFSTNEAVDGMGYCQASGDGAWVVCERAGDTPWLGHVASRQMQRISEQALERAHIEWQFSPNSRYLMYVTQEQFDGQSEVYLVDLQSLPPSPKMIATSETIPRFVVGQWSADSSFFTLFNIEEPEEFETLSVYSLAEQRLRNTGYHVAFDARMTGFGPNKNSILYSTQYSPSSPVQLVSVDANGAAREFDKNLDGQRYYASEFAPDGSAALYCMTGSAEIPSMVYSDLRGPVSSRSVRVPGDGSIFGCGHGFGGLSNGFAYVQRAPDGSETLRWVDIRKQVMAKPIPVSGEGRVVDFLWQPVANAKN